MCNNTNCLREDCLLDKCVCNSNWFGDNCNEYQQITGDCIPLQCDNYDNGGFYCIANPSDECLYHPDDCS